MSPIEKVLTDLSDEFDVIANDRLLMGAKQYGPLAFLDRDMIQNALEEIVDLSNYARMMYMKLRLMQIQLQKADEDDEASSDSTNQSLGGDGGSGLPFGIASFIAELPDV